MEGTRYSLSPPVHTAEPFLPPSEMQCSSSFKVVSRSDPGFEERARGTLLHQDGPRFGFALAGSLLVLLAPYGGAEGGQIAGVNHFGSCIHSRRQGRSGRRPPVLELVHDVVV